MNLKDFAKHFGALLPEGPFKPVILYNEGMDSLLYLNEDCSYRSERIDDVLDILWHPYEDRIVGIQLNGYRAMTKSRSTDVE